MDERDTRARAVERRFRAFKVFVVVACAVAPVIFAFWVTVPLALDGLEPWGDSLENGAIFGLCLASPGLLYAAVIRRRLPVVGVGVGLVALEIWAVWAAFTGESSTSGLATLWIPFAGLPLVILGWIVQAWSRPPDY